MCCDKNDKQLAFKVLALKRSEMPSMQITLSVSIIDINVCSQTSWNLKKTLRNLVRGWLKLIYLQAINRISISQQHQLTDRLKTDVLINWCTIKVE